MLDHFRQFVQISLTAIIKKHMTVLSFPSNRPMRFFVAGVINTLFGFVVYSICIIFGISVWLALLVGIFCGAVFNFFTTGGYVFREFSFTRFPRFVIFYLFIYGINLKLFELISIWLSNKILSQAIITLPLALFSYVLVAKFVFPKK